MSNTSFCVLNRRLIQWFYQDWNWNGVCFKDYVLVKHCDVFWFPLWDLAYVVEVLSQEIQGIVHIHGHYHGHWKAGIVTMRCLVHIMTSSNGNISALLAICAGNSPVPGEFPAQRPVTRSFDVYFDLRPNKRFSKQSWGWWFEALWCPSWRHRNESMILVLKVTRNLRIYYRNLL